MRSLFFMLSLLLLLPGLIFAQGTTGKMKGVVTDKDSKEPLIGATVSIVGTTYGAATDIQGNYVILNVPPGTYTVTASYVGYQTISVSNIIINTNLTTERDFPLTATDIELQPMEIIAERPLVNKNATNAVRITTSEDMQALAVRGVNNIIALSPGVVLQDNTIFIRGGRQDEVGYYLEGVPITNAMVGGRAVTLVQEALEEIQVQAGGYNAEFGGANSGIVQHQLKTGTANLKASLQYVTDNVGFKSSKNFFDGKKTLGAHSFGYNELTATLSGPISGDRFKFFGLFNYNFQRDQNPQPYPGINLGVITDPVTNDSVNLSYPAGPVFGNSLQQYTYTGTFTADFNPINVRIGGTYTLGTTFNAFSAARIAGNIANIMNTGRIEKIDTRNGSVNAKITHMLNPTTFYDLSFGYFRQTSKTYDPLLEDDFLHYGDSLTNAAVGVTNFTSRYGRPQRSDIFSFSFNAPGDVIADYVKFKREHINISGGLSTQLGSQHSVKIGGEFQRYTMRNYSFGNEAVFAIAGIIKDIETMPAGPVRDSLMRVTLINRGVNNFGYDVFGEETDEEGPNAPKHPIFGAIYLQDKIEYKDLILNIGLRYDYIDSDSKDFIDPTFPDVTFDNETGELFEDKVGPVDSGLVDVPTFSAVSPRIGISFPVSDKTVFHTQFGKFVQQSRLRDIFQGYYATAENVGGGFFINVPVGFNVRPTRTTQYEIGFTQQISDFASFDITGYYKDIQDQIVYDQQNVQTTSNFGSYFILKNGDFATTKGIELTFNMRRTKRVQMNLSLSFNDAQGTGSFPNSSRGVVGAPIEGNIFKPQYISPLEFNNSVRGNFNVDYHFGVNDGPPALHQFGASMLFKFNSGHPYTRGIGGDNLEGDARDRQPVEPLNSSTTPWQFQIDLRIDKSFKILDNLNANVYLNIINVFDTRNIENVFLRTGSVDDDGYLSDPEKGGRLVETYGPDYEAMYRAINIDYYEQYQNAPGLSTVPFFYGPPRQIRFGVRLDY